MRLCLHIGTGKTATTSIQAFLDMNREALQQQSILFPEKLGRPNNRKLPAMMVDDAFVDDFFKVNNLLSPQARSAAKTKWHAEFQEELAAHQNFNSTVISSEHLSTLLREPKQIEALKKKLDPHFETIKVLIYLREPIDFAVSMYNTAIKVGGARMAPVAAKDNLDVDYAALISRWATVFGQDNMVVRLFDRDALINADIIQDFCVAAGIDDTGLPRPTLHNPSLDQVGLELLRRVNKKIPRFIDNRPNPVRGPLIRYFETHFSSGQPYVPDPALVRDYEKTFRRSNAWVCKTFFPGKWKLFPKRKARFTTPAPLPGDALDRMADLIADIWQHKNNPPKKGPRA